MDLFNIFQAVESGHIDKSRVKRLKSNFFVVRRTIKALLSIDTYPTVIEDKTIDSQQDIDNLITSIMEDYIATGNVKYKLNKAIFNNNIQE